MHAESRVARSRVHDQPEGHYEWAKLAASDTQKPCSAAFAGLNLLTAADWDGLKDEIHGKLQEWQLGTRNWQRIRSDFETRIAAMEKSIGLLQPGSERIQGNL